MKKIAIYGGTFDPVHHGHLILARDAVEKLALDEVIFVPAAVSPLKKAAPFASGELRLTMLQAAIRDEPRFAVDDCELQRPPPSFTIDTVEEIQRHNSDATIYCLIGEDNVDTLSKWHRIAELEKMVKFVILDRSKGQGTHPYLVVHRKIDISATEIRKRVVSGQSIRYFVPQVVEEIIQREKIYQEPAK